MSSTTASTKADSASPAPLRAAPRMSFGRWVTQIGWRHAIALVAVFFALFPIFYIISVSLNPVGSLSAACPPSKTGLSALTCIWPSTISFDNYKDVLTDDLRPYTVWFRNTLTIALTVAITSTLMSASGAFAFSRLRFKGRRPGLLALVLLQMFPQLLALTAIFIIMTQMTEVFPGLGLGTTYGLIIIYLGGSLGVNTYLMKGFFDTIPVEIDESAKIDGASHVRIFFTLILRLAAPVLVVVFFVTFTGMFNELAIAQDPAARHPQHDPCRGPELLRLRQPAGVGPLLRRCPDGRHPDAAGLRAQPEVPDHGPDCGGCEGMTDRTLGPVGLLRPLRRSVAPRLSRGTNDRHRTDCTRRQELQLQLDSLLVGKD